MNKTDKICREALNVHSFCKEQVVKKLVLEASNGNLILSEASMTSVATFVEATLESSFQKAFETFHKSVDSIVCEDLKSK